MKRRSKIVAMTLALLVASLAQPIALRAEGTVNPVYLPQLVVAEIKGSSVLQAGLSGTYEVTIWNVGFEVAPVELHIIFAGAIDQTDRIIADSGLDCEIGHDAGINAVVRCTGGQVGRGGIVTVVVQGRGQAAGAGKLVATVNASRSVLERDNKYDDNIKQFNITIN